MKFQKTLNRRTKIEEQEDTKYYEEILKKRTMELLGIHNENMGRTERGGLRSQHI